MNVFIFIYLFSDILFFFSDTKQKEKSLDNIGDIKFDWHNSGASYFLLESRTPIQNMKI